MNKVDCITEAMEEVEEAKGIKIGINLLEKNDYPIDKVSKIVEIPIDRLKAEYDKFLQEKNSTSV